MKTLISAILFSLMISLTVEAQNYIYKGDRQYPATETWDFGSYPGLKAAIAKHSNGGYLMLTQYVPFKSHYIGGTVTVFLSNGALIKCTDKGIKDHVDGNSIALYNFTKSEIEQLKEHRIVRIRYSIITPGFGAENYTADNKKDYLRDSILLSDGTITGNPNSKGYYETDVEVSELYD